MTGEEEEEEDDAASAWAVEENDRDGGSLYPMYFGASCAFLALHLLSAARSPDIGGARRRRLGEMLLQGSASLLGLLLWRAQRAGEEMAALRRTEEEVSHLKRLRAEDAKANEKVVGIFASREQDWIAEKRKLRLQIQALMAQFRVLDVQKQEAAANFAGKILEKEAALEEETKRTGELEEKLRAAEKEAHDSAAEMGHALRRVEVAVAELAEARRQKDAAESAAEALTTEMAEMKRDGEQKEKILSAMLHKSKADAAERLALMKEVREKQAEMEVERLRRRRRASRGFSSMNVELSRGRTGFHNRTLLVDYLEAESSRESGFINTAAANADHLDRCSGEDGDEELDARNLQEWARSEAEKYAAVLRRRHRAELEAFADQMRLKDEKLETYRRRLIGMELESKRLQSHVEGLDGGLSYFREECVKHEALLLDREREIRALKNQLSFPMQNNRRSDPDCDSARSPLLRWRRREGPPTPEKSRGETMAEQGPPETSAGSKMDLHALGVSYKIKRLKQQLLALERLAAAQALSQPPGGGDDDGDGKEEHPPRGFLPAMTLLGKQVKRYQTLEEKADDLCKRMYRVGRGKERREALEGFLEEAFHLQRHVVASGQKLVGIQSWLTSGLIAGGGPKSAAAEFNLARFAAVVRILFREVQVGLEGLIARIIGNLEETLAYDAILHERR
ncbi:unnamed protein product [Spirodela intermedia]|uniref:Uncharacterized protein n=1 Tax=Spirodela intermedia TaxID=51605 RepID=A0A7I8KJM6_SPIIN|nr:unnamed protein product [Spirodela intermedia]